MQQDPVITTSPEKADNWLVAEDFKYCGHGLRLLIFKGTVTDLASIPRLFWNVIAPFELSLTAPLIHDCFYRAGGNFQGYRRTREQVDKLFLAIMKDEGVGWFRRNIAYRAVRMFGASAWQEKKQ